MDVAAHMCALIDYDQWANERILDAAEGLSPDDLARTPVGCASTGGFIAQAKLLNIDQIGLVWVREA